MHVAGKLGNRYSRAAEVRVSSHKCPSIPPDFGTLPHEHRHRRRQPMNSVSLTNTKNIGSAVSVASIPGFACAVNRLLIKKPTQGTSPEPRVWAASGSSASLSHHPDNGELEAIRALAT